MTISLPILSRYNKVLEKEPEIINQTKIKILAATIVSYISLCVGLFILYLFQQNTFLQFRLTIFLALYVVSILLLLYKSPWKFAGHTFIISLTILIWTSTFIFKQRVNIVTVQQAIIVLSISYYTLGEKWGTIYSFLNISPIVGLEIANTYFADSFGPANHTVSNVGFVIAIIFHFILLLFIHYSFFRAYKISNLKEQQLKNHLQKAVIAAEELAAAKTNFLSTMSHELRTPLNAVIGMANILITEDHKPEQRENLDILYFSAENLMGTINDILDFNKIDSSTIILSEDVLAIDQLLLNVHGTFKNRATEKGIAFDCHIDPQISNLSVIGDQTRLTQILLNLIGNAIKFTAKGHVSVNATILHRDTQTATFSFIIEDTGIGIPTERQEKVFEPFNQAIHRSNRQHHGTGLGLTIAQRLINLHNGTLKMQSTEGVGTTFNFEVTYTISAGNIIKPVNGIAQSSPLDQLRVLIAEDEPVNILVIKKILQKWSIVPDVVVNGYEALQAVMKKDYDVVLMDINMPVMDGFEAAKRIRELNDDKKSAVSIIAVTASLEAAVEQIGTYRYIDDCILKPFRPEYLKEKLENINTRVYRN